MISRRARAFDSSGIRKVFDLAARLDDPINLSIGQPDFSMPAEAQMAALPPCSRVYKSRYAANSASPNDIFA